MSENLQSIEISRDEYWSLWREVEKLINECSAISVGKGLQGKRGGGGPTRIVNKIHGEFKSINGPADSSKYAQLESLKKQLLDLKSRNGADLDVLTIIRIEEEQRERGGMSNV